MPNKKNFIDLNISSAKSGGKAKVKVFKLGLRAERGEYEELLNKQNSGDISINKEQFAYDKTGMAIITVWWEE